MASCLTEWVTSCFKIILAATVLHSSYKLFKDHRAPSVGLLLLGLSAAFSIFHPSSPYYASLQREAEWAAEVMSPALVSFDFLWLSEDHNMAHILLCGSCLLLGLSADTLTILTHCLSLLSLSCCLMVCLFAGNSLGAFGGMALSLPLLLAQRVGTETFAPLLFLAATEELMKLFLKGSLSIGCWASTLALGEFLLDLCNRTDSLGIYDCDRGDLQTEKKWKLDTWGFAAGCISSVLRPPA